MHFRRRRYTSDAAAATTKWRYTTVPKDPNHEKIRLCLDARVLNENIQRQRYPMPTLEDLTTKLKGATVFSRLDLAKGYHQLELDEKSRDLTSFSTHQGIYRYKRLFFGVSSAAEVFQNTLSQVLIDIANAHPLMDDILIFGSDYQDHDRALEATLKRLKERNLTVREDKCDMYMDEIAFYGTILGKEGLKPDPQKIKAIVDAPNPSDQKMLKSFLGTAGYLMKFIPDFATIVEPLRSLLKKNSSWIWGESQENSMRILKEILTSIPVLNYFDPQKETRLWVDASPVGLGAVLLQRIDSEHDYLPVAFASRALSPVEQRYAQIEREALAVLWACRRFRMFVLGKYFEVITDHKPLEHIFKNNKEQHSPRISRMLMKMQEYSCVVRYKPGLENIADYLSRSPTETNTPKENKEENLLEVYCVMQLNTQMPKAITLETLRKEYLKDRVLNKIKDILINGTDWNSNSEWTDEEVAFFKGLAKVQFDLSIVNGILLKKQSIIIPKDLQRQVITLAHQGHQGFTKTKSLLRSKVWFPHLDQLVEQQLSRCSACQSVGSPPNPSPLQMTELPAAAWKEVAIDFCGPLSSGKYLLVLVDEYSRYPVISTVISTSAHSTIAHLRRIFSMFGTPEKLKSDNGPPFFSKEFTSFMEEMGVQHRRITPLWPQANGTVERLMRSIKKVLQTSKIQGTNWEQDLEAWCKNYRATPHSTTGASPFEMMFNRKMTISIPHFDTSTPGEDQPGQFTIRDQNKKNKDKAKEYADIKRHSKQRLLQVGDKVLLRKTQKTKSDSLFDPIPWQVVNIKGTFVIVERKGKRIGRNISFLKKVPEDLPVKTSPQTGYGMHFVPEDQHQEDPQLHVHQDENAPHYQLRCRRAMRPPRRLIQEM